VIQALKSFSDRFLGRGEAAITVPPMDGALKPNRLIEDAEILATFDAPEDLATDGKSLLIADGRRVLRWQNGAGVEIATFDRPVTALACAADGSLIVALDGQQIRRADGQSWNAANGKPFVAINALSVGADGTIYATDGSKENPPEKWVHDLMGLGRSGRAIAIPAAGEPGEIASGLEYAFGIAAAGNEIWVSESWRHRVLSLTSNGGKGRPVVDRLPGYPSRLTPAAGGGFWLSVFITRTQLVEFVLRERDYRTRMMKEIDPRYWVSPALTSGNTFLEPMQGAHIKTMGILKPWAPPRSYGLVVRLAPDGLLRYSLHSRVDGKNHGVVAAIEIDGALYMLAKGPRRLLRISVQDVERSVQA
jgi:sugar lactone lactonase YvrE